ncbi:hypothetical protein E2C01_004390 [Portunus trituberculatus]|uniref:Uncharacterized protein n=1 Tax=Portunus trituberculatus TaxID=210409 RepID=A0A5B7CTX5_PORTR|nr:hypothetical protein [Portunus trituberculatus]
MEKSSCLLDQLEIAGEHSLLLLLKPVSFVHAANHLCLAGVWAEEPQYNIPAIFKCNVRPQGMTELLVKKSLECSAVILPINRDTTGRTG